MSKTRIVNVEQMIDRHKEQTKKNRQMIFGCVILVAIASLLLGKFWFIAAFAGSFIGLFTFGAMADSKAPLNEKLKSDLLEDAKHGFFSPQLKYDVEDYYKYFKAIKVNLKYIRANEVKYSDGPGGIYVDHPMIHVIYQPPESNSGHTIVQINLGDEWPFVNKNNPFSHSEE